MNKKLAKIKYLANNFEIVENGDHVLCAISGKVIKLEELTYWNVELQEAYFSYKEAFLKKELLRPTKIYVKEVLKLIDKNLINGCANITGGGLADNIKRIIPENLVAEIDLEKINTSKIFRWLKKNDISDKEMLKTFNCGVGFCLIISPKNLDKVKKYFTKEFKPYVIGKISKGKNKVKLNGSINWI